ncbi:VOC family protein [Streptomyces sp. H10-C2]|uniref:VOC family protein n=1 Tax=unclassified Streptomyces TaxID=2593676 RepID=UPI0024BB8E0E|nr:MULTISPECIES: VOC family protein [unclassified Streptomyces]MDJ0347132.1 VOC family protein [Streptomyces sp. PH10-H1]MDJ0375378.1 VOC family protein [Streptomyces sp. H10-C2]
MTEPFTTRFHHVSLSVADLDAQRRRYQQALGFAEVVEEYQLPEPPVRTAVLRAPDGPRIELIERAGSSRTEVFTDPLDACREQGYGHWALDVDDLEEAFALITRSGGEPVWPPADAVESGARFAYIKDPEGNLIELIQPAKAG